MEKITAVIPARYHSSRFPGKVLADICGKPMIQHVYERAQKASLPQRVIVATDDERILKVVLNFKGEAIMTSKTHRSGTDRLAEIAREDPSDIFINVQGDEPLIEPNMIDQVVRPLLEDPEIPMGTLKHKIKSLEELKNPHVVKVVTDLNDMALYFSRSPIPYFRREEYRVHYRHIGLYAYRREFILKFASLQPTFLEQAEELEQLRALENGFKIKVIETEYESIGVDTPEDLKEVIKRLQGG
jgi:3-deoxy-manno-octulosonate cytidylyltransferase (CMP-KDO synthetase)